MLLRLLWVLTRLRHLKAIREAEAYPGPSLIIAYAPCINHGLKKPVWVRARKKKKRLLSAVTGTCGVTTLLWKKKARIRSQLDSKEPNWEDFQGFLKGEVRYASVMKQYPAEAEELFKAAEENAKWRYNSYKRLARENWGADTAE